MAPLLTKPGLVPKEFIEGKRVRHIPPLRIVIFSSFIFFLILGLVMDPISSTDSDIDEFNQRLSEGLSGEATSDSLTLGSGILKIDLTGLDSITKSGPIDELDRISAAVKQGTTPEVAVDSIAGDASGIEKRYYIQWAKFESVDQETFRHYFLSNVSILILVIQPFFAFLLYLLHFRKRRTLRFIRHLVFSLYFHAWLLLLGIVALLFSQFVLRSSLIPVITLSALIYLGLAMKYFYEQGWGKTLLKLLLVILLYLGFVIPLFFLISILVSFFFF